MCDRNRLWAFWFLFASGDLMDSVQYFSVIIAIATCIADTDDYVFEDDETIFVFEHFPCYLSRSHSAFTKLTLKVVHSLLLPGLRNLIHCDNDVAIGA